MSTTFRFIDSIDRTAPPKWDIVFRDSDLKRIEENNQKEQRADVINAIEDIRALRFDKERWWIGAAGDFGTKTQVRDVGEPIEEHDIRETWTNIPSLLNSMKVLKNYAKTHQLFSMSDLEVKRAKRLLEKLDSGLIRIEQVTAVNEFARAEAYALFVAYHNSYSKRQMEGYLGHGGMTLVPLQRARMFDSETAVQKFLKGHYFLKYYPKIQVVKIQLNMIELTNVYDGGGSNVDRLSDSRIQHAAAFVQKENLEQALLNASKERLLERVKEMDVQEQEEAATPVKRRM